MNIKQIALVQSTLKKILPMADTVAALFYRRLFEVDPSLKPLFKGDLEKQGEKLMQMLSVTVAGLGMLEALVPMIRALGRRHVKYGVKDEHYDTVGAALLWTLEQALGDSFTLEVKEAWAEAYHFLAGVMKEAAGQVSAPVLN